MEEFYSLKKGKRGQSSHSSPWLLDFSSPQAQHPLIPRQPLRAARASAELQRP